MCSSTRVATLDVSLRTYFFVAQPVVLSTSADPTMNNAAALIFMATSTSFRLL